MKSLVVIAMFSSCLIFEVYRNPKGSVKCKIEALIHLDTPASRILQLDLSVPTKAFTSHRPQCLVTRDQSTDGDVHNKQKPSKNRAPRDRSRNLSLFSLVYLPVNHIFFLIRAFLSKRIASC